MHAYRGRTGPPRSTPTNVVCQKCLKRDIPRGSLISAAKLTGPARHYSYECKVAPQERPYRPRPSRTQQLRDPKLVPKLTSDVPDTLLKKKGVADQELAKKEAERSKKRALEEDDDGGSTKRTESRRRRSVSSRSASPAPSRHAASPPLRELPPSPGLPSRPAAREDQPAPSRSRSLSSSATSRFGRPRSLDSVGEEDSAGRSRPGPSRKSPGSRNRSRGERSPSGRRSRGRSTSSGTSSGTSRSGSSRRSTSRSNSARRHRQARLEVDRTPINVTSRIKSSDFFDDEPSRDRERHDSRSPERRPRRAGGGDRDEDRRRYRERDDRQEDRQEDRPERGQPARERSLSPFSRRLALTQSMNARR